jgi:hypothetical protein
MSDKVRIERERILLSKIKERYTKEQVELWGNVNLVVGATAITAVHFIALLLGALPFDWFWQGALLVVLIPVGYLSYRRYLQTTEAEE